MNMPSMFKIYPKERGSLSADSRRDLVESLPEVIRLTIESADRVILLDPNGFALRLLQGSLPLGLPFTVSELSGSKGYVYTAPDITLNITAEELIRLGGRSLTAEEYFVLRQKHGIFHDIHEDFYHPNDGAALQPMEGLAVKVDLSPLEV